MYCSTLSLGSSAAIDGAISGASSRKTPTSRAAKSRANLSATRADCEIRALIEINKNGLVGDHGLCTRETEAL